jgi:hypothetical protein
VSYLPLCLVLLWPFPLGHPLASPLILFVGNYGFKVWKQLAHELGTPKFQEIAKNGELVKQVLYKKYPLYSCRYNLPANTQEEWGFTVLDVVNALRDNKHHTLSGLAAKLGNEKFALNTKRGYLLKQLLLREGQNDLVAQLVGHTDICDKSARYVAPSHAKEIPRNIN